MRLHRLIVTNFAAVREVDIEFGPGLNVLYGPNDLGKSTLAEAIRLALLLPHASEAAEAYVGWTGGRDPVVDLTFETEPQRIWRVRKEFGKGGTSLLQESKNGRDFDDVERARKVDGRLREILRWGIPEPGGTTRTRGVPSSFLATALLSTQSDVSALLNTALDGDLIASGKEMIAAALQAVAQDPLFVALLKNVQARRDEAFTDKGAKKQAKGSVFKLAADRVKETREEKEKLEQLVSDSESTEKLLQSLHENRLQRNDALSASKDAVKSLEQLAAQTVDLAAAAERVRLAEQAVMRIRKLGTDVQDAEKAAVELVRVEEGAKEALKAAQKDKVDADAALKSAEESARNDGPNAGSDALRAQIELRIAAAEKVVTAAQQRVDAAVAAQSLGQAAAQAERDHTNQETQARKAEKSLMEVTAAEQAAAGELRRCELLEKVLEFRTAEKDAAAARSSVERHSTLQAQLKTAVDSHRLLTGQRAKLIVPSSAALIPMRQLATELASARGALDVGFVVTVTPKRSLGIAFQKDLGPTETVTVAESFEVEAASEVDLDIAELASVRIRGGRRETQQRVRTLEERWTREIAPHLKAAGATDLPGLDAKVAEAQNLDVSIKTKDTEIQTLRTQVESLAGAPDALRRASDRLESSRSALAGQTMETLSTELDRLGSDPASALRKRRQQFSEAVDIARNALSEAAIAHTVAQERVTNLKSLAVSAASKRDLALAAFPDGVTAALTAVRSAFAAATAQMETGKAELAGMDKTIAARKALVEEALAGARLRCAKAQGAVDEAQKILTQATADCAGQTAKIGERKKLRDAEDLAAAEGALREESTRHAALPIPERTITAAELDQAKSHEARLLSELQSIERDIQRAHGALEQVGGAVARERLRDATEAFEIALQFERDVEADYEAWKLLLEQMKEADAAQASNLGQTVAPAIASRFQALTDQRYEAVRLTASLGTEGIVVAGAVRPAERMSVGTREQLSTLYRLSLAEYLKTVVVLDDQLVQSDESRMDWFRALLREKSQDFQIIVFTCRPLDYLEKKFLVPKGKSLHADADKGSIRAIDLGRALRTGK